MHLLFRVVRRVLPRVNVLKGVANGVTITYDYGHHANDGPFKGSFILRQFAREPILFDQATGLMHFWDDGMFRIAIQPRDAGFARFTTGDSTLDEVAGDKLVLIEAARSYNPTACYHARSLTNLHVLQFDDVELTVHYLRDGSMLTETLVVARLSIFEDGRVVVEHAAMR